MEVGEPGGLGAAGIDDDESQSATLGVVERLDGVDLRPAARARDERVAPEDERDVGVHRVDGTAAQTPIRPRASALPGWSIVTALNMRPSPIAFMNAACIGQLHWLARLLVPMYEAIGERTVLIEDRSQLHRDLLHGDVHRDRREGTVR